MITGLLVDGQAGAKNECRNKLIEGADAAKTGLFAFFGEVC